MPLHTTHERSLSNSFLLAAMLCTSVGCANSVAEPPGEGVGGGGGGGGGGSGAAGPSASAAVASSSSGSTGPCVYAEDCASLSDACNVGACVNGVCTKAPTNEGVACDDGKFCSQGDSCTMGVCTSTTMPYCPPGDTCNIGQCSAATDACVVVPGNDGAACDDGDPCTGLGTCAGGGCSKGPPVDCSFLNGPCTVGTCDAALGCIQKPGNEGGPCNDFLFCTDNDTCQAGQCLGSPKACAPPNNPCMIGTCNEFMQTCTALPGNDGAVCDDGNFCTGGETCSAGQCVGGLPANAGAMCDDENGCTSGTTCQGGQCTNAASTISQCIDGDTCCPPGCPVDADCLYWQSGVQQNVPNAALTGWSLCYNDLYDNFSTPMQQILSQCDKAKLLLACRPVGAASYSTLAMAPRADVLFDCGFQTDCTMQSNGVGWYYSDNYSWGFAPGGESVSRNSCDVQNTGSGDRLCWHSSGAFINGGWRCGSTTDLNSNPGWERLIFEAD